MSNIRVNIFNRDYDDEEEDNSENQDQVRIHHYNMSLFPLLDLATLFGHMIEEVQLESAIQESEESYKVNERKNIKLNISCQRYDTAPTEETICGICQDEFNAEDMVSILDCKHIFHEGCVTEWGKFKPECPACRTEINHTEEQI